MVPGHPLPGPVVLGPLVFLGVAEPVSFESEAFRGIQRTPGRGVHIAVPPGRDQPAARDGTHIVEVVVRDGGDDDASVALQHRRAVVVEGFPACREHERDVGPLLPYVLMGDHGFTVTHRGPPVNRGQPESEHEFLDASARRQAWQDGRPAPS